MGWGSAVKSITSAAKAKPKYFTGAAVQSTLPIQYHKVDWAKLVVIDFESFYSTEYTLRRSSTSEYIRDPRFKAHMCGIKIGNRPTKVYPTAKIQAALDAIDWTTHSLLCHHTQFDGFIMSHHYGIKPHFVYDTLSMARGLFSNDIGSGLGEVAEYLGKGSKVAGVLEEMKGLETLPSELYKRGAVYCTQDVELTLEIFKDMLPMMPSAEIELIDLTVKMFTEPVLKVNIPLVEKELVREIAAKEALLLSSLGKPKDIEKMMKSAVATRPEITDMKKKGIDEPTPRDILLYRAKKAIGSNEVFAQMLRDVGVEPPRKVSEAYFKHKDESKKWTYAFAKTDLSFTSLMEYPDARVRDLVETRLSVKSTTNETRAGRFIAAGADGASLPVYLKFAGAHTWRWSGGNKMNMQNLKREDPDDPENTGILRKAILAPKGYEVVVVDSGQIEARFNGWFWDQHDLLDAFRDADAGKGVDAYCRFASKIYGRAITKKDKLERFVGKVAVLGLGYQMGWAKFQNTLALGSMGPAVFLEQDVCKGIVNTYRRENQMIVRGWKLCSEVILPGMARGVPGQHKCISWDKDHILLPNGVKLKYPKLKLERNPDTDWDEWTYERKGERVKIYGGLLCENIIQALARIAVAEQMLAIAKMGWRVVTMTHDEVVTIARKASAPKCFREMTKVMRTPPKWAPDIPLWSEGGHEINYSK